MYPSLSLELSVSQTWHFHLAKHMISVKGTEPVANFPASMVTIWSICKRRVKAIEMPMCTTLIAGDDLAPTQRRERTIVA